jgi:outer membrane protein assembly factor BamE (lipoprotein component of BamABCDE complex)
MKTLKLLCIVLPVIALAALSGCASSGNESLRKESESSIQQKVVEGKTTKAEVRQMFGSPLSTSFTDGGLEIWNFEMAKMSADAIDYVPIVGLFGGTASGTKKQLVILFDDKGVVKKCSMSESPVTVKTGLFNR